MLYVLNLFKKLLKTKGFESQAHNIPILQDIRRDDISEQQSEAAVLVPHDLFTLFTCACNYCCLPPHMHTLLCQCARILIY
jgi:hypothetical protein